MAYPGYITTQPIVVPPTVAMEPGVFGWVTI